MRFHLLTLGALALFADAVAGYCCVSSPPGAVDPCGNVETWKLKMESEITVAPDVCCCSTANSLACRTDCVSCTSPGVGRMLSVAVSGSSSTQPSWRKRERWVWVHRNDQHTCIMPSVRSIGQSATTRSPMSTWPSPAAPARPPSGAIGTALERRGERGSTHAGATDVLTWSVGLPGAIPRGTCRRRPARCSPPATDSPPSAKARLAQRCPTGTARRWTVARR
jgi:hypothetical protein